MNNHPQRPPIPSQLPIDKRNNEAGNICRYLNTAIKRAQRQGPIDEMRLDLNQAARAIERFENQHNDTDLVDRWKEVLKQLESCYHYFTQVLPNKTAEICDDSIGPKSWSNSWSGRDDNGII